MVFVHMVDDTLLGGKVFCRLIGGCHAILLLARKSSFDDIVSLSLSLEFSGLRLCSRYRIRLLL